MNELEQLEQRVLQLSSEDMAKCRAWFIEQDRKLWDKQIEADAAAGKLGLCGMKSPMHSDLLPFENVEHLTQHFQRATT